MTQQAITVPYQRTSPVHIPQRDLVLSSADSLLLTVTVVESDNPSANTLVLHTDVDGPSMQLVLWNDDERAAQYGYDYGRPNPLHGAVLQSISGVPGDAPGSWDFHLPTGSFANLPVRCGWTILLIWDEGFKTSVLAQGIVNFLRPFVTGVPLSASIVPPIPVKPPGYVSLVGLVTDAGHPIVTSDTALQLETS